MSGATIIFVLDELRRRKNEEDPLPEWGAMLAFGPGVTIEAMVLRVPSHNNK
jgi:bisdemethoxycurcumin synthase